MDLLAFFYLKFRQHHIYLRMLRLIFLGQGHGDNYQDTSLDVYQFFNTSCYSGYGDDDKVSFMFCCFCMYLRIKGCHLQ